MAEKVEVIRTQHFIARGMIIKCEGEASIEEWQEFGKKLISVEKFVQWHLGWWWNFGHKKWSRGADEFIATLGYKRHTLECYGSIYNKVKPSIRVEGLPFKHHQIVASLPDASSLTLGFSERTLPVRSPPMFLLGFRVAYSHKSFPRGVKESMYGEGKDLESSNYLYA